MVRQLDNNLRFSSPAFLLSWEVFHQEIPSNIDNTANNLQVWIYLTLFCQTRFHSRLTVEPETSIIYSDSVFLSKSWRVFHQHSTHLWGLGPRGTHCFLLAFLVFLRLFLLVGFGGFSPIETGRFDWPRVAFPLFFNVYTSNAQRLCAYNYSGFPPQIPACRVRRFFTNLRSHFSPLHLAHPQRTL